MGLVVVSHSKKIAEGVVELAQQMGEGVAIAAAGGTDDGGIGTSFDAVLAAIGHADSGDGVVILCDLGSAVLTAETAIEFADDAERIQVADAPIVEGAVAAAVASAGGAPLPEVLAAAEGQKQFATARAHDAGTASTASGEVTLVDEAGLHARPAAELAKIAAAHGTLLSVNGQDVTSVLGILGLGLKPGDRALIAATGGDAQGALGAALALLGGDAVE